MADESSNVKNEPTLTIIEGMLTKISNQERHFIASMLIISSKWSSPLLIDGGKAFDASFSGNCERVHRKLSNFSSREIPYIHCKSNALQLPIRNAKNNSCQQENFARCRLYAKITQKSSQILKISEAIDVRWLSNTMNDLKRSYHAIVMTCENIHEDGSDLSSLARGLLLD